MNVTKKRTVCDPNCHANPKCGLTATVEDGKIIAIEPADYPIADYANRICMMGRARIEYQYHPDRLRTPLKRVGARGEGKWEPISWEEAATLFVEKQKSIAEKYGPKSILFTVVSGAFSALTRGSPVRYAALTDATYTNNVSAFDVAVPKGLEYFFGVPANQYFLRSGHDFRDSKNSELILIWGLNAAVTRSVDHSPMKAARQKGTKLICIDPTRSETAGWCDDWISVRPGTDGALALAMARWMIQEDQIDHDFVLNHSDMPFLVKTNCGGLLRERDLVEGGSESPLVWCAKAEAAVAADAAQSPTLTHRGSVGLKDGSSISVQSVFSLHKLMVDAYTPEFAEEITGVPASQVTQLAKEYATAKPAAIRLGYGLDRYYYADTTARSIALLSCLGGHIGVPGGGISLMEGAAHANIQANKFYAPDGKRPSMLTWQQGDSAVKCGNPYPVKMECISLGNPYILAKPGYGNVLKEYLDGLEFITVIDHFMTDSAKLADLVLPACTIFEKDDVNIDRLVQLQQRIVEPEGEAKSDFEIFALFAEKMGLGDYFSKTPHEYIEEMFCSDSAHMKGVTFDRLLEEKVVAPNTSAEPYFGFKDRRFPTPSGRVECYKENLRAYGSELAVYREPIEASPKNPLYKKYPLVLLGSHSRYRIHSQFVNMEKMRAKEAEPFLRINPADASSRGIKDHGLVQVKNDRGFVKLRCSLDKALRPGTVLLSEGHWVEQFTEGEPYSLLHDHVNPTSDNYFQYDVLVEVCSV